MIWYSLQMPNICGNYQAYAYTHSNPAISIEDMRFCGCKIEKVLKSCRKQDELDKFLNLMFLHFFFYRREQKPRHQRPHKLVIYTSKHKNHLVFTFEANGVVRKSKDKQTKNKNTNHEIAVYKREREIHDKKLQQ